MLKQQAVFMTNSSSSSCLQDPVQSVGQDGAGKSLQWCAIYSYRSCVCVCLLAALPRQWLIKANGECVHCRGRWERCDIRSRLTNQSWVRVWCTAGCRGQSKDQHQLIDLARPLDGWTVHSREWEGGREVDDNAPISWPGGQRSLDHQFAFFFLCMCMCVLGDEGSGGGGEAWTYPPRVPHVSRGKTSWFFNLYFFGQVGFEGQDWFQVTTMEKQSSPLVDDLWPLTYMLLSGWVSWLSGSFQRRWLLKDKM